MHVLLQIWKQCYHCSKQSAKFAEDNKFQDNKFKIKKFKITNYDQYINHIQNCSINELQNKPVLLSDIFSISEAHIPRTIEYATLHELKTKVKSNPKSSTIEFKTGGRVSLGLLIHYTNLSKSYLICYKLYFLVLIL